MLSWFFEAADATDALCEASVLCRDVEACPHFPKDKHKASFVGGWGTRKVPLGEYPGDLAFLADTGDEWPGLLIEKLLHTTPCFGEGLDHLLAGPVAASELNDPRLPLLIVNAAREIGVVDMGDRPQPEVDQGPSEPLSERFFNEEGEALKRRLRRFRSGALLQSPGWDESSLQRAPECPRPLSISGTPSPSRPAFQQSPDVRTSP